MWYKTSQNSLQQLEKEQQGIYKIPQVKPINIMKPNISTTPKLWDKNTFRQLVTKQVEASGYCPCAKCCGNTRGITASGTKATAGRTIAVPPTIPLGTTVNVNGKPYIAEDRGGAIKGNHVDIFFNTHQEALNFGRKPVEISYYLPIDSSGKNAV